MQKNLPMLSLRLAIVEISCDLFFFYAWNSYLDNLYLGTVLRTSYDAHNHTYLLASS